MQDSGMQGKRVRHQNLHSSRTKNASQSPPGILHPRSCTLPQGRPGLGGLGGNSTQAIGASFWLCSPRRAVHRAIQSIGSGGKEKMPWLGRSQAEKSAEAVVGIRLVG